MVAISLVLAGLSWFCGWLCWGRFRSVQGEVRDQGISAAEVTVIIPARNEEHNLQRLLTSIQTQAEKPAEVVVVDDHSEDRTAEVAKNLGARVVRAPTLPPGWTGKNHACHVGAKAARTSWFLFLDADTELFPEGLRKLWQLPQDEKGAYSLCPFHRTEKLYEQLSAFFNVIMIAGSGAFTAWNRKGEAPRLFGQAMLVARASYEKAGGHAAVKAQVLENFFLAERFRAEGIPRYAYGGQGVIGMRMYPEGVKQLIEGWTKGFASGAAHTPKAVLILISLWISGAMAMPFVVLYAWPVHGWGGLTAAALGLYLAFVSQTFWIFRQAGSFGFFNALFYPIGLTFYNWLFVRSVRAAKKPGKATWKGRDVVGAA